MGTMGKVLRLQSPYNTGINTNTSFLQQGLTTGDSILCMSNHLENIAYLQNHIRVTSEKFSMRGLRDGNWIKILDTPYFKSTVHG